MQCNINTFLLGMITLLLNWAVPSEGAVQQRANGGMRGHWEGVVQDTKVDPDIGTDLGIQMDLAFDGKEWSGTIYVPAFGEQRFALTNFLGAEQAFQFSIEDGTAGRFVGRYENNQLQGFFVRGKVASPFSCGRQACEASRRPRRPQMPVPPFPYEEQDISYRSGEVILAGTLTIPKGEGTHPAVLFLPGSGPHDRDYSSARHRWFLVLADQFARVGIESLRMDSRGVGESGGSYYDTHFAQLSSDAKAGLEFLSARPEVTKDNIGLVGHCEGALVAAMTATRSKIATFIVMLSPVGVPIEENIVLQVQAIAARRGKSASDTADAVRQTRYLCALAKRNVPSSTVYEEAKVYLRGDRRDISAMECDTARWWAGTETRELLTVDPSKWYSQLVVPVLVISGDHDLIVPSDKNLEAIRHSLGTPGNGDAVFCLLKNLNHTLQPAVSGLPEEIINIEQTFDPDVLRIATAWLLKTTVRTGDHEEKRR